MMAIYFHFKQFLAFFSSLVVITLNKNKLFQKIKRSYYEKKMILKADC